MTSTAITYPRRVFVPTEFVRMFLVPPVLHRSQALILRCVVCAPKQRPTETLAETVAPP